MLWPIYFSEGSFDDLDVRAIKILCICLMAAMAGIVFFVISSVTVPANVVDCGYDEAAGKYYVVCDVYVKNAPAFNKAKDEKVLECKRHDLVLD